MPRFAAYSTVKRVGVVALVAALAFAAGGFFSARATPTPTTFYACLSAPLHLLYNVSTTSQHACGKTGVAVSWNQVGPQGPQGAKGDPGPIGTSILSGTGAPANTLGNDGDFYLDTEAEVLYGPKADDAWPAGGTSLIGPKGDTGPAGTVVASSCAAGDVVTGVASDGTVQCTNPDSPALQCSISNPYPGQNLADCYLSGANLTDVNLVGANLTNADLVGANLTGISLNGANLPFATLTNANLTNAFLYSDDLSAANLSGANLSGAHLGGANLSGVLWSNTTCPDGTNSNNDGGTCINNLG